MVRNLGGIRVEHLAAETGWNHKSLWCRFRSQIGLTPEHAAQLVRLDHAAHRGYADRSLLHRDVMVVAGVTSAAVASAPWLAVDPVAWAAPEYPVQDLTRRPAPVANGTFLQDVRQSRLSLCEYVQEPKWLPAAASSAASVRC